MALIKADIIMARQGIELYKSNEIKEVKNQAAYHLQQTAEKMIKIQIYRLGVPYENKSLYVHNLKVLIHYAELLDFGVRIPDFIRKNALIISDWEASSRYDIHFTIKITSLEKCYKEVTSWYDELRNCLQITDASFLPFSLYFRDFF